MRTISQQTVGRTNGDVSWSSGITGLARVLGVILFLALPTSAVHVLSATLPGAYQVVLGWDPSPSPEVVGYRIYSGAASGNYTNSLLVGNVTTHTVPGLASGVAYFFAVTALDTSGLESDFSNEVGYVPGLPAVRIRVTPTGQVVLTVKGLIDHTYHILATHTFTGWTVIGTVTLGANGSVDFTDTSAAGFPRRCYRTQEKP
jgi:hypothetical protein